MTTNYKWCGPSFCSVSATSLPPAWIAGMSWLMQWQCSSQSAVCSTTDVIFRAVVTSAMLLPSLRCHLRRRGHLSRHPPTHHILMPTRRHFLYRSLPSISSVRSPTYLFLRLVSHLFYGVKSILPFLSENKPIDIFLFAFTCFFEVADSSSNPRLSRSSIRILAGRRALYQLNFFVVFW